MEAQCLQERKEIEAYLWAKLSPTIDQCNVEKSRAIEPLNVGFNSRVKRLVPSKDGGVVRRHRFSKVENSWTAECELPNGALIAVVGEGLGVGGGCAFDGSIVLVLLRGHPVWIYIPGCERKASVPMGLHGVLLLSDAFVLMS